MALLPPLGIAFLGYNIADALFGASMVSVCGCGCGCGCGCASMVRVRVCASLVSACACRWVGVLIFLQQNIVSAVVLQLLVQKLLLAAQGIYVPPKN